MQIINLYSLPIQMDQFSDCVPVLSTATNLLNLFLKCVGNPSPHKEGLQHHYFTHLNQKSTLRCLILLVPVIGNIFNAIINHWNGRKTSEEVVSEAIQAEADLEDLVGIVNFESNILPVTKLPEVPLVEYRANGDLIEFNGLRKEGEEKLPVDLVKQYLNYKNGIGCEVNPAEALKCLKQAVELKEPSALFELASFYIEGNSLFGIDVDVEKGFALMKESAEKNFTFAYFHLFQMYTRGIYLKEGPTIALEYLNKSVLHKDPLGLFQLGLFYLSGSPDFNIIKDEKKGFELFHEANNKQDLAAKYYLYWCYKEGMGTVVDFEKSLKYLLELAAIKYHYALFDLALLYLDGSDCFGIVQNEKKGYELLLDVPKNHANTSYIIYDYLRFISGTETDKIKSLEYLIYAVEHMKNPIAIHDLGVIYLYDFAEMGIEQDKKKGFELMIQSANKFYPKAMFELFNCYSMGLGTQPYPSIALECLLAAAHLKEPRALCKLGRFYIEGASHLNIVKDPTKSIPLFEEAAKQNYSLGLLRLGLCYKNGWGVAIDNVRASQYFQQVIDLNEEGEILENAKELIKVLQPQ